MHIETSDREKLIKAYMEIDKSIHRMRAWQHRLENTVDEIKGDMAALYELMGEIEDLLAADQEVGA